MFFFKRLKKGNVLDFSIKVKEIKMYLIKILINKYKYITVNILSSLIYVFREEESFRG